MCELIFRLGRAGASWRRRVDRWRRGRERPGSALPPQPGAPEFGVQVGNQLIQVGRVLPGLDGVVTVGLGLGAVLHPHCLHFVRGRWAGDGFGVQVPALPALSGPQILGPFRAWRAEIGEGGPAGNEYLLDIARLGVGAAELDRTQAGPVILSDRAHRLTSSGLCQPLNTSGPVGHWSSPASRW